MRVRPVHTGVSDDLDVLLACLAPAPEKRFVTVSAHGAGEAALSLAAFGAEEVLALDLEAPEMLARLLALKIHAATRLGREDYLVTMGLRPASKLRRRALAHQLIRALPRSQQQWWRARRSWLEEGLFHADRQAGFFRAFQTGVSLLSPPGGEAQVFQGPSPAARRDAFERFVARPWLRRGLGQLARRVNLFFPANEWRASEYPRELAGDPLGYLGGLVEAGLAESPLFAPQIRGKNAVLPEHLLPPHLRTRDFDRLRRGAARAHALVAPRGADPLSLPASGRSVHGAYLSNAVDYLRHDRRRHLFSELRRILVPDAPILVYSNERWPKVPLELGFALDAEASAQAQALDRAHIYRRIEVYRVYTPGVARLKVVD